MPKKTKQIPKHWEPLIELFKAEVADHSDKVDPDENHHWLTLTYGWAIAKGLSFDDAIDFAGHIRYETDLG